MRFYELPPEVETKIRNTDSRPFVRVVFELAGGDVYIPDFDILECVTTSYKTEDGGIVNFANNSVDFSGSSLAFPVQNTAKSIMPQVIITLDSGCNKR